MEIIGIFFIILVIAFIYFIYLLPAQNSVQSFEKYMEQVQSDYPSLIEAEKPIVCDCDNIILPENWTIDPTNVSIAPIYVSEECGNLSEIVTKGYYLEDGFDQI